MVRKRLLKADKALADIEAVVPFSLVNPENTDAIKERFLKDPYEPDFTYGSLPDLDDAEQALEDITLRRSAYDKLLAKDREHLKKKIALVRAIGTDAFSERCEAVYGAPTEALIERAKDFLDLPQEPKARSIPYDEVVEILEDVFGLLGFSYTIKRKEMVSSALLKNSQRTLYLKSKESFSRKYVYRLAVHEIATHAVRAENGRRQDLDLLRRGTPGYLTTEEGLAAYNEERAGVMDTRIIRSYAGRVLAIAHARTHTFKETYEHLREWFSAEDAFTLTLRAKRGLPGGQAPGACTKDLAYLEGYLAVKEYATSNDLSPLWAGKISLADVEVLGKKLAPPAHTPEPVIEWVRQELVKHPIGEKT